MKIGFCALGLLIIPALVILNGCAAQKTFVEDYGWLIGQNESTAIRLWGVPNGTLNLSNSQKAYSWQEPWYQAPSVTQTTTIIVDKSGTIKSINRQPYP